MPRWRNGIRAGLKILWPNRAVWVRVPLSALGRSVAQLVARLVWDEEAPGSSPGTPTRAGVAQLVRASVFQTEGRGFETLLPLKREYGGCSSMVEHLFVEQKVAGSIPVSHPRPYLHNLLRLR